MVIKYNRLRSEFHKKHEFSPAKDIILCDNRLFNSFLHFRCFRCFNLHSVSDYRIGDKIAVVDERYNPVNWCFRLRYNNRDYIFVYQKPADDYSYQRLIALIDYILSCYSLSCALNDCLLEFSENL